jgi:hypothetical protein
MRVLLLLAMLGPALALAGSLRTDPEKIRNASGETPVRFVYCFLKDDKCEVLARFKNMYECERHWEIYNSYCDRKSTPGVISCRRQDSPLKDVEFSTHCVP